MTTFVEFFDEVLPSAPGCIEAVAEKAIRDAAIEFCRGSFAWQIDHPMIPLVAGQHTYTLTPPADTYVVEILKPIRCAGRDLQMQAREDVSSTNLDTWTAAQPSFLLQEEPRSVRVLPIPTVNITDGLRFRVALTPTETASGIETRIYQQHREAIAYGALARLMFQPKKPYSDPDRAGVNQALFQRAITRTWNEVQRGYSGRGDISFTL